MAGTTDKVLGTRETFMERLHGDPHEQKLMKATVAKYMQPDIQMGIVRTFARLSPPQ